MFLTINTRPNEQPLAFYDLKAAFRVYSIRSESVNAQNLWRMSMNIYIGNLPYEVTDDKLRELFAAHGEVSSAMVIKDKMTGRSRGFAFVEMPSDDDAQKAIDALNGSNVDGKNIVVNQAKPKTDNRSDGRRGYGRR